MCLSQPLDNIVKRSNSILNSPDLEAEIAFIYSQKVIFLKKI